MRAAGARGARHQRLCIRLPGVTILLIRVTIPDSLPDGRRKVPAAVLRHGQLLANRQISRASGSPTQVCTCWISTDVPIMGNKECASGDAKGGRHDSARQGPPARR
jgi:hypothetical protein